MVESACTSKGCSRSLIQHSGIKQSQLASMLQRVANGRSLVLALVVVLAPTDTGLGLADVDVRGPTTAGCICGGDLHWHFRCYKISPYRGTVHDPSFDNRLAVHSMNEAIHPLIVSPNSVAG